MPLPPLPFWPRRLAACLLLGTSGLLGAQTAPAPTTAPAKKAMAALPARVLTVELRVGTEAPERSSGQQWGTATEADEEWQKISVANGEKGRFEFGTAQAWGWTHTAARGNGAGSVDGVGQSLQWAQEVRALECQVRWAGGTKPARMEVSVQVFESGKGSVDGVLPQPRASKVQTVVWAPLGTWVTLARSGPRPPLYSEGTYSSRSAEAAPARVLQVRVLAPD